MPCARPALLLTALVALGCSEANDAPTAGADPPPEPTSILLLTFDTLRRDHLGVYGYALDTSPEIDAFAAAATRFDDAYATAPWTLPTHASLLTGLHPFEHGARTLDPKPALSAQKGLNAAPLDLVRVTLAETLRAEGFRTGAFVANPLFLGVKFQLNQGFDVYEVEKTSAAEINVRALAWLDEQRRLAPDAPFFLFLNYLDTHRPYRSQPSNPRLPAASDEDPGQLLKDLTAAVMEEDDADPSALRERLIAHYDQAIANADAAFGQLLDALRARGLFDDTLIAITSDHGEFFGEHDLVEHSKDVYQPVIRAPLIVKAARQTAGSVDARTVTSVDVPRLILDATPSLEGRHDAQYSYAVGEHPSVVENYYSRAKDLRRSYGYRFDRIRTVLLFGNHKYIHSSDGQHELYDLVADPGETVNLQTVQPERSRLAREQLEVFQAGRRVDATAVAVDVSDEEATLLEDLGYL